MDMLFISERLIKKGNYTMENYLKLLFKVNYKEKTIAKWYVCGIEKYKNKYYIIAKSNNRNKTKFTTIRISFSQFGLDVFTTRKDAELNLKEDSETEEYEVNYKCGHTIEKTLNKRKANKIIIHSKNLLCPICKNKVSEAMGCILIEMPYAEFKKNYKKNDYKVDSYNPETKTIKVYINQEKQEIL